MKSVYDYLNKSVADNYFELLSEAKKLSDSSERESFLYKIAETNNLRLVKDLYYEGFRVNTFPTIMNESFEYLFSKQLNERPVESGILSNASSYSKEDTYDSLLELKVPYKIISSNIGGLYDIVRITDTYYLVDHNTKKYLGYIEGNNITIRGKPAFIIKLTFSKLSKGFYGIMFNEILHKTDIKYLVGDESQSTQAKGSWKKLLDSFNSYIYNTQTDKLYELTKDNFEDAFGADKRNLRLCVSLNKELREEHIEWLNTQNHIQRLLETSPEDYLKYYYPNGIMDI